jgi:hypothetical protein
MRTALRIVLALAVAALAGCPEPEPPEPIAPGTLLLELTPPEPAPGQEVEATVTVGGDAEPTIELTAGERYWSALPLEVVAGGHVGRVPFAMDELGDHVVHARIASASGEQHLFDLLTVTRQPACPEGLRREAGLCLAVEAGPSLEPAGRFAAGADQVDAPLAAAMGDGAVVGCFGRSIAAVARADLQAEPAAPTPALATPMEDAGFARCDALVVDRERGLAVTATIGDDEGSGGLATWRLEPLDAAPSTRPDHVDTVSLGGEVGGVTLEGGVLWVAVDSARLEAWALGDDAGLAPLGGLDLPDVVDAAGVARVGDLLVVTDAGLLLPADPDAPERASLLTVVDGSDPAAPAVVGQVRACTARSAVAIGADAVALACGDEGLQLWSLREADAPDLLASIDTPDVALWVDASAGYLLAAEWSSIALYDVAEPESPRLVQASDLPLATAAPGPDDQDGSLRGARFVALHEGDWLATDRDGLRAGRVAPGRRGPSLELTARRLLLSSSVDDHDHQPLRLRNRGRGPLTVSASADGVALEPTSLLLPPLTAGAMSLDHDGTGEPADLPITLQSDDPLGPTRLAMVRDTGPGYLLGQLLPPIRAPSIGACDDGDCPEGAVRCLDSAALPDDRPRVYVFFSSI